ncbi:hypothetical protein [Peterkaempfera sp. SMS 1(5)a]|uniref:hypothetical protein n=1 Tax=Peterkaempfera podocarpi TaxID=3232308 RepID=UPI003672817B
MDRSRERLYELIRRECEVTYTRPRVCAAIADPLTCKGTLIQASTDSHRLRAAEVDRADDGREAGGKP